MSGINAGRVLGGGLLAGLVFNILDFAANQMLRSDWEAAMTRLNLPTSALEAPSVMVTWIAVDFLFGILVVWTYAAIRPRFGPGPKTAAMAGSVIPAEITVYSDRSFTLVLRTPPAADLLRKAAGVEKGASNPLRDVAGTVTRAQVREIAQTKMPDLNAHDVEAAVRMVEGTARSMGIRITE